MISKQELLEYSRIISLDPGIVEKDYVLGWILTAIYQIPEVSSHWVFKGGTCLKKCYFETYRFSEDLDFTIIDSNQIDELFLHDVLNHISLWVYEESGIELPSERIHVEIFKNPRGILSSQCKMGYIGPLQRRGSIPNIKFDISPDEILVLEPITRDIYHPYSDKIESVMQVSCYSYEEVFAEKIRALYERSRPRDLYDVIHMYRNNDLISDVNILISVLDKKCSYKGLESPTFQLIDNHPRKAELSSEWENMLKHQISVLPALKHYWDDLPEFFGWLYNNESIEYEKLEVEIGSVHWSQGRLVEFNRNALFIDKIQFAASNRLCITLTYHSKNRTIEPYSFRKSKEGVILFYGYEQESSQIKCFKMDKFQSVDLTDKVYTPRYLVEISSVGNI